ncbi:MAG: hypothetical protein LBQ62_01510, partial [Candidatus Accumulibacter sp.]|nr:hypothetical protein [Accumulibacter sp.]
MWIKDLFWMDAGRAASGALARKGATRWRWVKDIPRQDVGDFPFDSGRRMFHPVQWTRRSHREKLPSASSVVSNTGLRHQKEQGNHEEKIISAGNETGAEESR